MAASRDVGAYLAEQQKVSSPELASEWGNIEDLYNKKLWHQLTLTLLKFVRIEEFTKGDGLVQLYHNFLADFEHRINPLSLMEIVLFIVRQITDPKEAVAFLEKIQERVKSSEEASILCLTTVGSIHLRNKELDETKNVVEKTSAMLENLDGVTTVHGRFYELSSNYYKLMGNHAEYYKDALRYLGCVDIETIPGPEQVDRAFNLGLAALLGKGVYNFGELLAHQILDSLKNTDKQWLVDLLYTFNSGDMNKFHELKPKWHTQNDLKNAEAFLLEKIHLLCIMEMTFKRPANHRQLTFKEIASEAQIDVSDVELLVMRALSLGLVRGSIDQVEEKVHMTWVQPRVLDVKQIGSMQLRLKQWCEDVRSMENLVEVKAQDILT